ncbi:MAG: DUF4434 domain-containing protein [Lentisphaeria bacterium]|nr:DUF4434 domain-containing protein [Lentisphaeria bacterium]
MLKNAGIKPISGTFANMLISDTGIVNAGLKDWENDFKMMKAIGMDHIFIIRTECEQNGVYLSAEDPRSTTWPEDECLLDMIFRLSEDYGMTVYLGGPQSITNLHKGDWHKEVDDTKRYYDRTVAKYEKFRCFRGLYVTLEALPWHFNFLDICTEVLIYMRKNFPQMKTFMSPGFRGLKGDMSSQYSVDEWVDIYGRYFFERVAGLLDYCAPQDKITCPACRYGKILDNGIREWYTKVGELFDRCGIELWTNVETFQQPFPGHGEPSGVYRQIDYRSLYMKLLEASPLVKKIITYEFFSLMSPNTEWGSSRRLLARYLEMLGKDPAIIDEIYGR